MEIGKARENVIELSLRLLNGGLIVRTWGNVSHRLDANHFVITPSGKRYDGLGKEDIPIVNISDGRSWGDARPSSEKGVHLAGYADCADVNVIIHTHQQEASLLAAFAEDVSLRDGKGFFSDRIPCAAYALPGTEALTANVRRAFDGGRHRVVLMAHHGVVIYGEDADGAFRTGAALEMYASFFLRRAFEVFLGRPLRMDDRIYDILSSEQGGTVADEVVPMLSSERMNNDILFHLAPNHSALAEELPAEIVAGEAVAIHRAIYATRPDVGAIIHGVTPALKAASALTMPLYAYFDDFAQINGERMEHAPCVADAVIAALGDRHGVFLDGVGALSCGRDLLDAEAHLIVAEKNAKAQLLIPVFPDWHPEPIDPVDVAEMRRFYLESYALRF